MAVIPSDQALIRFRENENRFDIFINEETGYTSSGNEHVPSLIEFLDEKSAAIDQAALGATATAALAACQAAQAAAELAETNAETAETNAETAASQAAASAAAAAQSAEEAEGATPSLVSASNALAARVNMEDPNVWYDACSVNLAAGTWLLLGHITFSQQLDGWYEFQIGNGATCYAAANWNRGTEEGYATKRITLSMSAIVVLAAPATVKLQARTNADSTICPFIYHETYPTGLAKATMLNAVKIAG